MIGNFGFQELLLILLIILIVFGAKRLPELARSLGKAMTEFKKGMKEVGKEAELEEEEEEKEEEEIKKNKTER